MPESTRKPSTKHDVTEEDLDEVIDNLSRPKGSKRPKFVTTEDWLKTRPRVSTAPPILPMRSFATMTDDEKAEMKRLYEKPSKESRLIEYKKKHQVTPAQPCRICGNDQQGSYPAPNMDAIICEYCLTTGWILA